MSVEVIDPPAARPATIPWVDDRVTAHFRAAARLYRTWSPEGHLHFGYWRWPFAPWDRKAMLHELVMQAARRLEIEGDARVADLGCGYGAAARAIAGTWPLSHVDGITVVDEQVRIGQEEVIAAGLQRRVRLHQRDFRRTGLPDASCDAVIALESLCYATGTAKRDVVQEMMRILKPGGRFAITDGFLIGHHRKRALFGRMHATACRGWGMRTFARRKDFLNALQEAGFTDIRVRDLTLRIAPAAFHALPLTIACWITEHLRGEAFSEGERAHLVSCLLGVPLGLCWHRFRYLMITGRKMTT